VKKDGGVFPGLGAEDAVQIMAISDIFTALAEDRPYRSGMEAERIKTILQEQADRGFQDPRIIKLLFENMEEVRKAVKERQEQARYNYQVELEKSE
jgi:HD-GYP domain-containing protein (c-di-GMP phosphodiesterase class II)